MITLLVCWAAFPAVLAALSLGLGLLIEQLAGVRVQPALVLPVGFAGIVVVTTLTTATDSTARLTTPLVVALAVFGALVALKHRVGALLDAAAGACAVAAYVAFGAPVLASGKATFAGYIKLDDTATFLAMLDRALEHGRSVQGLAPSTYETTLAINLAGGYPLGSFLPLGVVHQLLQVDAAWLFQPYLAFLGGLLALTLYALLGRLVPQRWVRALVAAVAAQSALLYGYAQWGGVKELFAAAVVPLVAATAPLALRPTSKLSPLVPAIAVAALLNGLSAGGVVWLLPLGAAFCVVVLRRRGSARPASVFLVACAALSLPVLLQAGSIVNARSELQSGDVLGNLIRPLDVLQLLGIWPTGDFRLHPGETGPTYALLVICGSAAAFGLILALRRRDVALLLYAASGLLGAAVVVWYGAPWIAAKALVTASPLPLALALAGAGALIGVGRRVEGGVLLVALAGGVLWSNALAYREVWLAPRGTSRRARVDRRALRRRRPGAHDRVPALRRSPFPARARPGRGIRVAAAARPASQRLHAREGRVRGPRPIRPRRPVRLPDARAPALPAREPASGALRAGLVGALLRGVAALVEPAAVVLADLPLDDTFEPAAVAPCGAVERIARMAERSGGEVVAVARARTLVVGLGPGGGVVPAPGPIATDVSVSAPGRYEIWVGGSFRSSLSLRVDGRPVGAARHRLNETGQYTLLATIPFHRGSHRLVLEVGGAGLHPGSGGAVFALGPLVLHAVPDRERLVEVRPAGAGSLCRRKLDWVEALAPG